MRLEAGRMTPADKNPNRKPRWKHVLVPEALPQVVVPQP
jgi:hypothetical protein